MRLACFNLYGVLICEREDVRVPVCGDGTRVQMDERAHLVRQVRALFLFLALSLLAGIMSLFGRGSSSNNGTINPQAVEIAISE